MDDLSLKSSLQVPIGKIHWQQGIHLPFQKRQSQLIMMVNMLPIITI